ncbi:hypothetical protein BT69DRAFT_1181827, partial [Atractiella rhizophila]
RLPIRDVVTWWNSLFLCLERALLLRQAFDGLTEQSSFKLKKYEVMEPEWKVLGELQDVLKV